MCKYCNDSWPRVSNNGFYLNADDKELWYDNDFDCAVEVNISFCPWCGRPLNTDETKEIYLVAYCQNATIYDIEWMDTKEEAKRIATRELEPDESRYLYTYRLVQTQKVFLPSECIFEDVE